MNPLCSFETILAQCPPLYFHHCVYQAAVCFSTQVETLLGSPLDSAVLLEGIGVDLHLVSGWVKEKHVIEVLKIRHLARLQYETTS